MRLDRGIFMTFEGLDGCGKSTQIARLRETLSRRGFDVLATREPGGSAIGQRIRSILLDSRTAGLTSVAELALMFADRSQHINDVIGPALRQGKVVLCDRYTDSTEAYQGYGRHLGSQLVLNLHSQLCHDLWPNLTIFLDSDRDASLARARSRNEKSDSAEGRFESEDAAFFRRVHQGFLDIAAREHGRVIRVTVGTIQSTEAEVLKAIDERLPQLGGCATVTTQ